MSERAHEPGSRRSTTSRRRVDASVVLAVLLPLALVGLAVLTGRGVEPSGGAAPTSVPLAQTVLVCPSGPSVARVGASEGASGTVEARVGPDAAGVDVEVVGGAPVEVPDSGDQPVVLSAGADLAPSLVGGRVASPLAAAECLPPSFDVWFTGVGAGAEHGSTLELVNPDRGPAVVEVTVQGSRGAVAAEDAEDLRGVRVPGDSVVSVDLPSTVPRRGELALHVVTVRGRAVASVLDRQDPLGGGDVVEDYLPAQSVPATDNLLLGPPLTDGDDPAVDEQQTLVLANPGDDETRASLQVVTAESQFAPEGLEDVVVPPRSVVTVPVGGVLTAPAGDGDDDEADRVLGLRVGSDQPVTATLRSLIDGDLVSTVPADPVAAATTLAVPADVEKQLVLGGAADDVTVTVAPVGADGEALEEQRVELGEARAAVLDLPQEAELVTVTPSGGSVQGVVTLTGNGLAALRLRPQQTEALVPDVRPGPR